MFVRQIRRFRAWSPGCVLMCVLACAAGSLAQDSAPAEYTEAVQRALEELDANNLPEALAEFRHAHRVFPNARSLRGIGMVEFDLREYERAARHLQEALASREKPLAGALRAETEQLLARALRYLGEIRIVTDPKDAKLLIDGSPVQQQPDGSLLLNLGEHTIEVSAPGRLTETRTLQVSGGDRRQLVVSLRMVDRAQASESALAAPMTPTSSRSEARPAYQRWWVWTLVAVAVAGGATTAAIVLTRDDPDERPVEGTNTVGAKLHALRAF
jgi:hypothetical protein